MDHATDEQDAKAFEDTKGAGPEMINFTPVAAQKVKDLLSQRGTPDIGLRIGVRGGGCSGNSYFMEFCGRIGDEVGVPRHPALSI
jgi:hypothetical protein